MLRTAEPIPFPCSGAAAFLKPDAAPVTIIQRRLDGRYLVSRVVPRKRRSASTEFSVELAQLAATAAEADELSASRRRRVAEPAPPAARPRRADPERQIRPRSTGPRRR
jgi:hypothetical protein